MYWCEIQVYVYMHAGKASITGQDVRILTLRIKLSCSKCQQCTCTIIHNTFKGSTLLPSQFFSILITNCQRGILLLSK